MNLISKVRDSISDLNKFERSALIGENGLQPYMLCTNMFVLSDAVRECEDFLQYVELEWIGIRGSSVFLGMSTMTLGAIRMRFF
ncbi:hypothetical protein GCM10011282_21030 [Undibacterium macrobrachii]|uniref:Uncharacterized protein n=1 Tax=Undibacterium macrobrachii TaxID=1119058 RepID=A0ABQ2XFN3_9BURK|nr:hypothetical protein GCM10011282_21030 [Undibacterium macrobrachii]